MAQILIEKGTFSRTHSRTMSLCTHLKQALESLCVWFGMLAKNCHTLAKNYTNLRGREACDRSFRRSLVDGILSANPVENQDDENFVHKLSLFAGKKRKRCRGCLDDGQSEKKTRYFCSACEGQPAICPEHYHHFH